MITYLIKFTDDPTEIAHAFLSFAIISQVLVDVNELGYRHKHYANERMSFTVHLLHTNKPKAALKKVNVSVRKRANWNSRRSSVR